MPSMRLSPGLMGVISPRRNRAASQARSKVGAVQYRAPPFTTGRAHAAMGRSGRGAARHDESGLSQRARSDGGERVSVPDLGVTRQSVAASSAAGTPTEDVNPVWEVLMAPLPAGTSGAIGLGQSLATAVGALR